ncbi:HEAT repeat domain-containing protein [Planctomycetota bacterium]
MNKKFIWTIVIAALCLLVLFSQWGEGKNNNKFERGETICKGKTPCWHYLRIPMVYDEPCGCPCCVHIYSCKDVPLPKDWDSECAKTKSFDCYLKRHRAAWGLKCSEQYVQGDSPFKKWLNYPFRSASAAIDKDTIADHMKEEIERETRVFGKRPVIIVSEHFYLVTDIPFLKVKMTRGMPDRKIYTHEIAHLFIYRAERAYEDFVKVFGDDLRLAGPMGIFLTNSTMIRQRVCSAYTRNPNCNLNYGASRKTPNFGFAGLCFAGCRDQHIDDDGLHLFVRHEIGHLLMATLKGFDLDTNPKWLWIGTAHWLSRLPPRLSERAVVCTNEGPVVPLPGQTWMEKIKKDIKFGRYFPFSESMLIDVINKVSHIVHRQYWSYFVFLIENYREEFVQTVYDIKAGMSTRGALKNNFKGCSTGHYDEVWQAYIFEKKTMPSLFTGDKDIDWQLKSIAEEENYFSQASMVRDLEKAKDIKTAKLLVDLLGRQSDLVRESALIVLGNSDDPEVRQWLREEAIFKSSNVSSAMVAKLLGIYKDKEAIGTLLEALEHKFWLTRANACFSLAQIGDYKAIDPIIKKVLDSEPKVRIAAIDALALWKIQAKPAIGVIAENLDHKAWQVRVSAADALGEIGSKEAIDPLLKRMEKEYGRVREDIARALKKLTGIDYKLDLIKWQTWWSQNRDHFKGPAPKKKPKVDDSAYSGVKLPEYYGIKIVSKFIVYVLDISKSMEDLLPLKNRNWRNPMIESNRQKPNDYANDKDKRKNEDLSGKTKLAIAKEELIDSILKHKQGTEFNLILFNHKAKRWSRNKMLKSDEYTKGSICKNIRGIHPDGTTNYHDVFKILFGIEKNDTYETRFLSIADTVFFLTDGRPTEGEITRSDELLQFFNDRNRFAKMKVHVIALGKSDIDQEFLRNLAEQNQGTFLHIGGERE